MKHKQIHICIFSLAYALTGNSVIAKETVKPKHLDELACTAGQVAKFDGTQWVCGEDIDTDTDTDTSAATECAASEVLLGDGSCVELPSPVCPPGAPTRFVDNGDGTICDHQTGLMWEAKDAGDGVEDLSNPHDVDNRYTWGNAGDGDITNPDGTTFTDFLPRLNSYTDDPSTVGFAGYTDWRMPTSAELLTLLFESFPCSISPCIVDPVFAPTATDFWQYWSSTSSAADPRQVWAVSFSDGNVAVKSKGGEIIITHGPVRAVRGGR